MKKSSVPKRNGRPAVPSPSSAHSVPPLDKLFPIVGVGASAGGLEAFSSFLAHLSPTTGMAFVLVQHLDPSHSSALEEILSRKTKIPVSEATDGMPVQPNHVYVMPAHADMTIQNGTLRLFPRPLARGVHRPIDNFFRSLAQDCGDRSISVILSGTASDGTSGCKSIHEVGGITFAQDEASAKYNSMPASAAAAGCIDFVLPPRQIAEELSRIAKLPYVRRPPSNQEEPLGAESRDTMHGLFNMLREAKGVDFSLYKQSTLQRRIKRRMLVNNLENLPDYVRFIKKHSAELAHLYDDLLIPVTNFFRDPLAFDALRNLVFPHLIGNGGSPSFRFWVPGCATGEEAYSLAMLFLEFWSDNPKTSSLPAPQLQIFATDISEGVLERARVGSYPESALTGVSQARLTRFFLPVDGKYRINKSLRDLCVFARQNITKDPPFSNLDLITCRNLLIYFGPDLQKRVIPSLHYALKPSGYLMVGSAESLTSFADQFSTVDKKHRIYRKNATSPRLMTYFTGVAPSRRALDPKIPNPLPAESAIEREVDRVLAARFVPASIVVNSDLQIVRFRGKTGPFLEPASGQPTFSLAKMAREGLFVDLRAALGKAKKENVSVRKQAVPLQSDGATRLIDFEVVPIGALDISERFYLIVFQKTPPQLGAPSTEKRLTGKLSRKDSTLARHNERLTREVHQLRDHLQSVVEENDASAEEFKTANEEVLSSNEELQSTNEELETAKEELQSSNEELTTLNEEIQNSNTEMGIINNDLLNLLANASISVLMVDAEGRIRRFTPTAQDLLNLRIQDIGRPLGEIRGALEAIDLAAIALETIETAQFQEREVSAANGAWYQLRVRPYKTMDNRIEGAVISFTDITAVKRSAEHLKLYADALVENATQPILLLDAKLRVFVANRSFCDLFRVSFPETEGRLIYELGNNQWNIPALRQLLTRVTRDDAIVTDFEVRHTFEGIGERVMVLTARRVEPTAAGFMIFLSIEDVTHTRQQLASLQRQAVLLNLAHDAIIVRDPQGKIQSWNEGAEKLYGWKHQEAIGKITHELLQTRFPQPPDDILEHVHSSGYWQGQLVHKHRNGDEIFVSSHWSSLQKAGGLIVEINTDVSARERSEQTLRQLSTYLMRLQDEERRRIARELHDSTGQKLAAAKLQLDTLVKSGNLHSHEKSVADVAQWIDESFQEIRTLSHLLHPPLLDEAGLVSATRWLVDGFSKRAKIEVDLQIEPDLGRLPQTVELAIFRVIQEALSNILRHSGANQAHVKLTRNKGLVSLQIRDNGKGMPPEVLARSSERRQIVGVGVLGMRERLAQLGGSLEIQSDKSGTTLLVSVPIPAAAAG